MSLLSTGGAAALPATVETTIFDASVDGGTVHGFRLKNNSDIITANIRVNGLHVGDALAPLAPGEDRLFTYGADYNGIEKISGFGVGGSLSLSGYVQSRK
jgi:hypothetical protein